MKNGRAFAARPVQGGNAPKGSQTVRSLRRVSKEIFAGRTLELELSFRKWLTCSKIAHFLAVAAGVNALVIIMDDELSVRSYEGHALETPNGPKA